MLIVALVLAVIGLAALVTAVVTSNELIAWVCIAASVLGVILLIVDAIRERHNRPGQDAEPATAPATAESAESATAETTAYSETDGTVDSTYSTFDANYPDNEAVTETQTDEPAEAADEPGEAADEAADEPEKPEETESSGESGSH
jgi:hypothetical protein